MFDCSLKAILSLGLVVSISACGSVCPFSKHKLELQEVRPATTIPVSRLEIKKIDNTKKIITPKNIENSVRYLAETLYFADGSANLSADDYAKIRKIAKVAKEKNAMVSVYGYASSRTRDTDLVTHKLINFEISARRADMVAETLIKCGIQPDKINVEALSDSKPLYLEIMPKGERLNRRVEIFVNY